MVKGAALLWLDKEIQAAVRDRGLLLSHEEEAWLQEIRNINSPNLSPHFGTRIF